MVINGDIYTSLERAKSIHCSLRKSQIEKQHDYSLSLPLKYSKYFHAKGSHFHFCLASSLITLVPGPCYFMTALMGWAWSSIVIIDDVVFPAMSYRFLQTEIWSPEVGWFFSWYKYRIAVTLKRFFLFCLLFSIFSSIIIKVSWRFTHWREIILDFEMTGN